ERKRRIGEKTAPQKSIALQDFALHGLPGDIVKTVLPYTEAHPAALLVHILVSYGNIIGHNAHFRVEHTPHYLNLFAVLVGATSRSRKGTSRSTPGYIFQQVDPSWHKSRIKSGLSSGQGLIWAVRDPVMESRPNAAGEHEGKIVDPGEGDKRLLVIEEEFSHALKQMPLEGNVLSAVVREAWDSGNLNTLTSGRKLKPVTATDAHISIIGHVTQEELLRHLNATEQANGFANRFLWLSIERSKLIANPKGTPDKLLEPLIERLRHAVAFGVKAGEIERDPSAEGIWNACYSNLTDDIPGMIGAITSRAAPQVMRIACLYALLDLSATVGPEHLRAALALWDYCFHSARLIFGNSLGDPVADTILSAIKGADDGLTATDIYNLFSRHGSDDIDRAVALLLRSRLIEEISIPTKGR